VHEFERAVTDPVNHTYVLQLYIAGSTPRSQRAVVNIKKICKFLKGKCELQVIDVFQQPLLAKAEQIFAVPTLIKKLPTPKRLFIGDMSDTKTILAGLDS
jgi:circadian clock protein KaiB